MKVQGDLNPGLYSYHEQPRDRSKVLVRFYENVHEIQEENYSGYEYDEYYLEIDNRENIGDYIKNHFMELKAEAKNEGSLLEKLRADLDYVMLVGGY